MVERLEWKLPQLNHHQLHTHKCWSLRKTTEPEMNGYDKTSTWITSLSHVYNSIIHCCNMPVTTLWWYLIGRGTFNIILSGIRKTYVWLSFQGSQRSAKTVWSTLRKLQMLELKKETYSVTQQPSQDSLDMKFYHQHRLLQTSSAHMRIVRNHSKQNIRHSSVRMSLQSSKIIQKSSERVNGEAIGWSPVDLHERKQCTPWH
jgi:hypothetical protein